MRLGHLTWLALTLAVVMCDLRTRFFKRRRREQRESDFELMERYWREELPLGFFVNQGASETGDSPAPAGFSLRDKISEKQGGSGDGIEIRRDDVPKPTESVILAHEKSKVVADNEKADSEETGKLAAKMESSSDSKNENEKKTDREERPDPGDKTKARHSVTCQGQKEWLQCDGPYELIKIKSAFWGRDNDYTCAKSGVTHGLRTDKNCAQDESNTMTKVREACDNENVCEVVASGIYFDKNDCSDVYKYLTLDWECAPSESRIKESIS